MKEYRKIPSLCFLYEVSFDGKIRNVKSKRIRKPTKNSSGYDNNQFTQKSILKKHNKNKVYNSLTHRLVAEVWLDKPKQNQEINHKDGNKQNNHKDNLEWVTHRENIQHSFDNGLNRVHNKAIENMERVNKDRRKRILCVELGLEFPSACKCAEYIMKIRDKKYTANLKNTSTHIGRVAKQKRGVAYKYHFNYID